MPKNSLKKHYAARLQSTNFDLIKIEDFFKLDNLEEVIKDHKVDFYTVLFILKNDGKHSIDFTDYSYNKGSILLIRKDQIQKFYYNKNTKGYLLFFKEDFLNSYLNVKEISKTIQMFNELILSPKTQLDTVSFRDVSLLLKYIDLEYNNVSDKHSLKIIRSFLHVLITVVHRLKSKEHSKIKLSKYLKEFISFQDLLENEFAKTKKVFDYANMLGYSTKKLNTIVKFVTDKSAKTFIDETVNIKVKRLLLHTELSVKEIAFKVGFNDPSNLYKYFKKQTNSTPEEFRKVHKL